MGQLEETKAGFKVPKRWLRNSLGEFLYLGLLVALLATVFGPIASCQRRGFMEACQEVHPEKECRIRWKASHPLD